jgi:cysteine desulfurase family protein
VQSLSFALNATDALNLALKGILQSGDHVVTDSLEHNSVSRPLEALKARGVEYTKVGASACDGVRVDDVRAAFKSNTKLAVFTHVSNVTGTENPLAELGALCREKGVLFLVDAAQSAGSRPIDVQAQCIDMLAFPGHKGLLGPQGTGALYVRDGIILAPLKEGGTGSRSEDLAMPASGPDRYESGTQNVAGIAALGEGIRFVQTQGIESIQEHEARLANRLIAGLFAIKGVTLYGPPAKDNRSGVVSFTVGGTEPQQIASILDSAFGIAVRSGLHCAPDAHRTLGTLSTGGTVRASFGIFNTNDDADALIAAVTHCRG